MNRKIKELIKQFDFEKVKKVTDTTDMEDGNE